MSGGRVLRRARKDTSRGCAAGAWLAVLVASCTAAPPIAVPTSVGEVRAPTAAEGDALAAQLQSVAAAVAGGTPATDGQAMADYDDFYTAAKGMMYNPVVTKAFSFTAADSLLYGSTGFGNACLMAKQVLSANQGTRYVEITLGGWDMHTNIYAANQLPTLTRTLDNGLSQLITDLKGQGLLHPDAPVPA